MVGNLNSFIVKAKKAEVPSKDWLIIEANPDTFASTREISQEIANISATGNENWKMKKVTLPITYGRYQNHQSLSFETLKKI